MVAANVAREYTASSWWLSMLSGSTQLVHGSCQCCQGVHSYIMYILKHTSAVNYADDSTLGSRGDTLWKALEDVKTNTKSAITWYKNNQMPHNSCICTLAKATDTDFQCEGINIKSEDMVKMLGINIDKKEPEIHLSCYRSNQKVCIPIEFFKAKIQNIKY